MTTEGKNDFFCLKCDKNIREEDKFTHQSDCKKTNVMPDLLHCVKCDKFIDKPEFYDHMLCHNLQAESYINNVDNINNNSNNYPNNNNQNTQFRINRNINFNNNNVPNNYTISNINRYPNPVYNPSKNNYLNIISGVQ